MTTYNIEAEDMSLSNFEVVQGEDASSGELVKSTGLNQWGGLDTTFEGQAGTYDLTLHVQDEADGQSQIWVLVNGGDVAMVNLDKDSDGWGSDDGGFSEITFQGLELKPGDTVSLVTYSDSGEFTRIDKLVIETGVVPVASDSIVIEAEDMHLSNFSVVQGDEASSGGLVKMDGLNEWGEMSTTFDGPAGSYDLSIFAQDEADGLGKIYVQVNGVDVAAFTMNQDDDGWGSDDGGFSKFTALRLDLQPGDTVSLVTQSQSGEWMRIDKLELTPHGPANEAWGTVAGRYFNDENCDGLEGQSEAGFGDKLIRLRDVDTGAIVAETRTDADGNYRFEGVTPGDYCVIFEPIDGFEPTALDVGHDFRIDSDLKSNGESVIFHLGAGGEQLHVDAGLKATGTPPEALDDSLTVFKNETGSINILANDSDPDGDAISVTAIEGGEIGQAFTVTTDAGNTGTVTVQADGSFTFDPDDSFMALAQGETDSFDLTYTITDDPTANTKHNLMFVLDISNSTVGAGGGNNVFDGTGVGDVNVDGQANTVLDAEIAAVLAAVQNLIDEGVDPANIDVGIVTFSGVASGFASVDAETLGTFVLDDAGLSAVLESIQSGGWTNYEAGLQEAENWFASQAGDGAQNKLVFLSDGRPIVGYDDNAGQYITQTDADYGDEVSRIANEYGAEIYGIGVGANSDLDYLNDLDNTGGAERVLDADMLNVVVENAVAQPASSTATVTVTINGLNEAPDALNDALTVFENETGSINILANDSDADGDAISIVEIAGRAVGESFEVTTADGRTGTVTVQANGALTFNPGAGFVDLNDTETDSFQLTYTITDGSGTSSDRTADFEGLARGTIVSDQIAGVSVSAFRSGQDASAPNMAMIFDADNPTGGDGDLGVAGIGNLLIISEDGIGTDPDDNAGGGTIIFDFDSPTTVNGLTFVDIDHGESAPKIDLFDASGNLITSLDGIFTGDGQKGDFAIDTAGVSRMEVTLAGSGGINDLDFTETVMTEGLTDTATVTVIVNGIGEPVDAVNDAFSIGEEEDIDANLLVNDTPNDGTLTVIGVAEDGTAQNVGESFTVTTDGGREGIVTVQADGTFTFDGGDNFIELAEGQTDTVDVTYTVEGEAIAGDVPKHNILFVIDVSGSTSPAEFGGSAVGDQNGDGIENSVLDAEIAAYKELSQTIADSGLSADKVDIGLISFASTGATQFLGTFDAGSGSLDTALENLTDGGLTNFEEPLQVGINWFEDQAATTDDKNIVYFLSDGMQNTGGTFDDEASELAARFGAELNAVGVGNGAVLSQLQQIDNTGGAEIVTTTDALTAALVDTAPVIPGDQDTATVTITINGIGVSAGDDALQTNEETAATIDILANDAAPAGLGLCVVGVSGDVATNANVGSAFMVTTTAGRQGMVTVMEDGSFNFDPQDGFTSLSATETDSFALNYTMAAGAMFGELSYELYDGTPAGNTVANIPLSGAVASGTVDNLDTAALAVAATGDATTYAVRYTGVLTIEEAGDYDFNLGSDDGSALFIDGVQVIDNDGLHGIVNVPGSANLSAGQHTIEILFFQAGGGAGLSLDYSGIDTGGVAASIFPASASQSFETAEAIVEVTVLGLDSAPVAVDDLLVTDEDTAATINILLNDSDPEDDPLTVLSIEGGTVGVPMSVTTGDNRTGSVIVQSDGTFTFDPLTGFEDLVDGTTDTVTLTYTATDGTVGDTATVTVLVTGTGNANGTVTIQGSISASVSGQSHVAIVLDASAFTTGFGAGLTLTDLDNDGNTGAVMDLMLQKVLDLANTLNDDDKITLIPSGTGDVDLDTISLTYSVREIKDAADPSNPLTPQALFNPLVSTYFGNDIAIDLPQALEKAEEVLTSIGADENQVLVMASTDTLDQAGSVAASQLLTTNTNASIDVLYIEAGAFADLNNLNAIDTSGGVDEDPNFDFGLATLINPAPDLLATVEDFTVLIDGQAVADIDQTSLTVNAAGDGFDFLGDVELNGPSGEVDIVVAIDTDLDPNTAAEVFTLSDTVTSGDRTVLDLETFVFDFA